MKQNKKTRVIVISREHGSGGSEIGKKLAARLNIPYYDKAFVDKAVEDSGLSTDFMQEEEQKFISSLLFSLATGGYHHYGDKSMADQVFIAESDAIREVARQGDCVIVGRCADYILRGECEVFSVFVHAPLNYRVKRIARADGGDSRRVEQAVREKDRARARHYEYYTDCVWGDRNNYHLSINSERFGTDGAVDLILKALELA